MSEGGRRCPLCCAWSHAALGGAHLRCNLCALAFPTRGEGLPPLEHYRGPDGDHRFPNWNSWLGRATGHRAGLPGRGFGFAPGTVRMFAARRHRRVVRLDSLLPLTSVFAPWLLGTILRAAIEDMPRSGRDRALTLGVIASVDAREDVLALCSGMAGCAAHAVIVLDTADRAVAASWEDGLRAAAGTMQARVIAHPLGNDFAAQRNRVQAAAPTEWVLQLDADEVLTPGTRALLPGMVDDAERNGWDAVGLARRNVVDGVLSALYPDVQYRLLRRSVRFTRAVHEHPVLRGRKAAFVHLGAEIVHSVAGRRLALRESRYGGIEAGADRPDDTALLRRPLEPGIVLPG